MRIIYRYLAKEVATAMVGLTTILLLIFISNQFVNYLTRAAAGKIPGMIVLKLLMLEVPVLVGLLLPLGLFIALLVAYGRLYADNEMTVLAACGFSQRQLLSFTMTMALLVTVIVTVIVCWLSPKISRDRDHLLTSGGASAFVETLIPGRFRAVNQGSKVFYVESMSRDHGQAADLFMAEKLSAPGGQSNWRILTARAGKLREQGEQVYLQLQHGHEYEGQPGKRDYRIASFDAYEARLPQAKPRIRKYENALPMTALWPLNNKDLRKVAELNWRLAIPIMTLLLAFLAVPLSVVQPRQGKYAKMLPAIIIYIFYANMLFVGRDWLSDGDIPAWAGMWWLHASIFLLATGLYFWPQRRRRRKQVTS